MFACVWSRSCPDIMGEHFVFIGVEGLLLSVLGDGSGFMLASRLAHVGSVRLGLSSKACVSRGINLVYGLRCRICVPILLVCGICVGACRCIV